MVGGWYDENQKDVVEGGWWVVGMMRIRRTWWRVGGGWLVW